MTSSSHTHTLRACFVCDGEQMHSVLGIPAASHICPLAHFHNEIESEKGREREGGGGEMESQWGSGRRFFLLLLFYYFSSFFLSPHLMSPNDSARPGVEICFFFPPFFFPAMSIVGKSEKQEVPHHHLSPAPRLLPSQNTSEVCPR